MTSILLVLLLLSSAAYSAGQVLGGSQTNLAAVIVPGYGVESVPSYTKYPLANNSYPDELIGGTNGYKLWITYVDNSDSKVEKGLNGNDLSADLGTGEGVKEVPFHLYYAGNPAGAGNTPAIQFSSMGWFLDYIGSSGEALVPISFKNSRVALANGFTDNSTSDNSVVIGYPGGLRNGEYVAEIVASWERGTDLPAGNYVAEIEVMVAGE